MIKNIGLLMIQMRSLKIATDENGPGDNEAGAPRLTPRERELPPEDQFEEEIGGIFFLCVMKYSIQNISGTGLVPKSVSLL